MAKKIIKADCRTCAHAGAEQNYMCLCSITGQFTAVGVHVCINYKSK